MQSLDFQLIVWERQLEMEKEKMTEPSRLADQKISKAV